jgi:hypothetical protein
LDAHDCHRLHLALVAGGGTAVASSLITGADIKDNSVTGKDIRNRSLTSADIEKGAIKESRLSRGVRTKLNRSVSGSPGHGQPGPQGPPGKDAQTVVRALNGRPFAATNASVSLTPDGVEFGPYTDGGAAGGSLYFSGLNGQRLSAVRSLVYYIRYVAEGDTGGVGAPYLRVFLENDTHDAIFSPNTQPPDPDVEEGPFHEWVATSGVWRYDDDAGSGGPYGLNGAPFSTLIADHGTERISGIYITTGFSAGTNLAALLRWWEINGQRYAFAG